MFRYPRLLALLAFFLFVLSGCASSRFALEDAETKEKMILGACTWNEWKHNAAWSTYDAPDYTPDPEILPRLAQALNTQDVSLLIFGGSWCGDTKSELPKYFKLFSALNFPQSSLSLHGVSRKKREPTGIAERYSIKRVPTLVVLKGGNEIGRIVEYPTESIEKDLLKILTK
ncbi:MAG: TlpA family protein disulfide reductase [Chlorobiales bacterium]